MNIECCPHVQLGACEVQTMIMMHPFTLVFLFYISQMYCKFEILTAFNFYPIELSIKQISSIDS